MIAPTTVTIWKLPPRAKRQEHRTAIQLNVA